MINDGTNQVVDDGSQYFAEDDVEQENIAQENIAQDDAEVYICLQSLVYT